MKQQDINIGGRPAVVTDVGRIRRKKGWGYYNLVSVRFSDTGEYHSMGAGEFSKWSSRLEREHKAAAKSR